MNQDSNEIRHLTAYATIFNRGYWVANTGADNVHNDFHGKAQFVVQAGVVRGGIHHHNSRRGELPQPRQLPTGTQGFTNRTAVLQQLDKLLESWADADERPPTLPLIAAILGPPGVGKTALALQWAHKIRHLFEDGDLYVDMQEYSSESSLSIGQVLDYFLRTLDVNPERIPIDLDERAALYRSALGSKKILLVIDNVASVRHIRYILPGSNQCLVIVTSRSRLSGLVTREGAARVNLDVLSPEDSIQLLTEFIGDERIDSDYEAAVSVAALCGYLPLALRVVAERAATRVHTPLSELARELVAEQNRLDALTSEDELSNVRAVFSWSYRALSSEQQKVFRTLGLHPGSEFSSSVAAALVNAPHSVIGRQLQELASVHLIQEVAPDRYRLHDLLKMYSRERAQLEDRQRERTHSVRRMFSWYLIAADAARQAILPYSHAVIVPQTELPSAPHFDNIRSAVEWYKTERLNILSILEQTMDLGHYDIAWKLPVVADGFFEMHSYWVEWKQIHVEGLLAAETIGDRLGEAANLLCLGDVSWRNGAHEAALQYYERATGIANQIGDRWVEGFSLRGSGLVHQDQGDSARALDKFTRALHTFCHGSVRRGEGMSLLSLGRTNHQLGQVERASEYCRESIEIFRDLNDHWSLAWALIPFTEIACELTQFEAAEQHAREALSIFESFGDRRSKALAFEVLGVVLRSQSRDSEALECWTTALEILDELDDPHSEKIASRIVELNPRGLT